MPMPLDLDVAEAFLAGCWTGTDIEQHVNASKDDVWQVLRSPVSMAWISNQLVAHTQRRLGLLSIRMWHRAMDGDVPAAKLVLDRLSPLQSVAHIVHHAGIDLGKLTDDELTLVLKEKLHAARTLQLTEGGEGADDSSSGREDSASSGSTISVVQTVEETRDPPQPTPGEAGAAADRGEQVGEDLVGDK